MAKIEVLRSNAPRIGPIGIVTMGDGAARIGQQMAIAGRNIREQAYKYAYDIEKNKGTKEAQLAAISIRDEKTGTLSFADTPKSLSPVAEKYYEPIAQERFINELKVNIDSTAQALANLEVNRRNPEGFEEQFGAYLDKQVEDSGKFSNFTKQIGLLASKQYASKLAQDKVKHDEGVALAFAVANQNIANSDVETLASKDGGQGAADARYEQELKNLALIQSTNESASTSFLSNGIQKLNASYARGTLTRISNRAAELWDSAFPDADPARKAPHMSSILNYMTIALREGTINTSKIPANIQRGLGRAGLTDSVINSKQFAGVQIEMSRHLQALQGQIQEQFNIESTARLTDAAKTKLGAFGGVGQTDADLISNSYGVTSGVDFARLMDQILIPPQNEQQRKSWEEYYGPMQEMILGGKGALPQQVIDYFDSVDNLDSDQILTAVSLYSLAKRSFDGRITRINPRGIKDDTRVKFEALANVVDTLGNAAAPDFLNNLQIYMDKTKESKDEMLRTALGNDVSVRQFIRENVDSDATEEEIAFYESYIPTVVSVSGKERASTILKNSAGAVFRESNLMHSSIRRSRFTPERAYGDIPAELNDFKKSVEDKLLLVQSSSDKKLKLGVNVFLVPDRRSGTVLPVYALVDKDKLPIKGRNGKTLLVGPQYVLQQSQKRTKLSIDELRARARTSESRYKKTQELYDSGELIDVIANPGGPLFLPD